MGNKSSKMITVVKSRSTADKIYRIRENLYQMNLRKALARIDNNFRTGVTNWWLMYNNQTADYYIWDEWKERFNLDVKNDLERRGFSNVLVKQKDGYTDRFTVFCECTPLPKYKATVA